MSEHGDRWTWWYSTQTGDSVEGSELTQTYFFSQKIRF